MSRTRWRLHRLKGLERPERIVRLDAPGLPVVALALRASRERAGNLPHSSTTLIGRHEELSRLVETLGTHRLATITGTGGAGKTRLALAAGHALADRFPDGTWMVEFGELHDAADVPSAVATTLALQPTSLTDRAASTAAALTDQHALLLLDNCEHLIDGVIELVTELESHCDRITVLATSREVLGLGHEVRFNLHPLRLEPEEGTSDATALFCERAAAVLGTFQPSDADVTLIDEICRRLDGLPLAIELATARLSAMSLSELRTHLDDRFELLTRRRGVRRHSTIGMRPHHLCQGRPRRGCGMISTTTPPVSGEPGDFIATSPPELSCRIPGDDVENSGPAPSQGASGRQGRRHTRRTPWPSTCCSSTTEARRRRSTMSRWTSGGPTRSTYTSGS